MRSPDTANSPSRNTGDEWLRMNRRARSRVASSMSATCGITFYPAFVVATRHGTGPFGTRPGHGLAPFAPHGLDTLLLVFRIGGGGRL